METIVVYGLKVALVLFLFWGIYHIFLRRETFYLFNRIFLLAGLITATFSPLIKVHYPVVNVLVPPTNGAGVTEVFATTVENVAVGSIPFPWAEFLFFAYFSGLFAFLVFELIGLFRIGHMIRKQGYQVYPDYYLIESPVCKAPFSFFRFVFLPESLKNETERRIILDHEKAHVKQNHWVDLLLSTVFKTLWWFNPVGWLYEKSIRENHEFLADHMVLNKYNRSDYVSVLANQWFGHPLFPVTNSFNYQSQLKRIKMMKKNNSNPLKKLSVFLLVPMLALFFWAFAEPIYQDEYASALEASSERLDGAKTLESFLAAAHIVITDTIIETNTAEFWTRGIPSAKTAPNFIIVDGVKKETSDLNKIDPSDIESFSILKEASAIARYGEEGKNGVIVIKTKKAKGVQDVENFLAAARTVTTDTIQRTNTAEFWTRGISSTKTAPGFIVVDGVKKETSDLNKIDPNDIESFSVLKEASAIAAYGEEGKDGVIIITTKKAAVSKHHSGE